MTRAQKVAKAQELRAQGLTLRVIGNRLGVAGTTILRWVDPEKAEADRARARRWKARNRERVRAYDCAYINNPDTRKPCSRCGEATRESSGLDRAGMAEIVCLACLQQDVAERDHELEGLWAAGKTFPEIQLHFGWTRGNLGRYMDAARGRGADLPYRYTTGKRAGRKFRELRAA